MKKNYIDKQTTKIKIRHKLLDNNLSAKNIFFPVKYIFSYEHIYIYLYKNM